MTPATIKKQLDRAAQRRAKQSTPTKGDHMLNPDVTPPGTSTTAAVLILLTEKKDGLHVVFTERSKDLPVHPGQISFPGGKKEKKDTTAAMTALREAKEEIGLNPDNACVLGELPPYLTRSGYNVTPVVALLEKKQPFNPDPKEVTRIFEVPLRFLFAQGRIQEESVATEGNNRNFYAIYWQNTRIWGATAAMVKDLRDCVNARENIFQRFLGI